MSRPTPVLLMVRELGIGGCERDLAKIAKGLDRERFEPHVGCLRPEGLRTAEMQASGIPIVQFPVKSFGSWSAVSGARQMGRYIRTHKIQLVHAFDMPMDLFGVPTARFYRTPVVIKSHLSYRSLVPSAYHRPMAFTDKLAHAVVVNSNAVQEDLIRNYGIARQRTYLCYNGVETEVFHPTPRERQAPVRDAEVVIGAVCALRPEKRLDTLLDAFARVRNRHAGIQLLIVGSGPMLPALQEQARGLALGTSCYFEPSKSDVAPWMRSMDIFVLASDSESFPNALLEAMACGCCPVGSRVGGVPELISDGYNGLLFEPGNVADLSNQLAKLIDDSTMRGDLAKAAATTAKGQFSIEIAVRRIEGLYNVMLHSAGVTQ